MWGIIALGIWAVAILGANLSGVIPASVYGALHASRLEGSTLNQLRAQVGTLEEDTIKLQRDTLQLTQRFNMGEEAAGSVTKRVGALEVSIPKLIEQAQPKRGAIDTMTTGAIDPGKTLTFETEGGTVAVRQRPLIPGSNDVKLSVVPLVASTMPEPIAPSAPSAGIAIGAPVMADAAEAEWQEMLNQVGTMLVGLSPVLANSESTGGKMLVAGPLVDKASAIELCARMSEAGIACEPTDYAGEPMPLLN